MARRGRPRQAQPPVIYQLKLRLRPGEDDDLLTFLAAIPLRCRPAAVKAALRAGSLTNLQVAGLPADDDVAAALAAGGLLFE